MFVRMVARLETLEPWKVSSELDLAILFAAATYALGHLRYTDCCQNYIWENCRTACHTIADSQHNLQATPRLHAGVL